MQLIAGVVYFTSSGGPNVLDAGILTGGETRSLCSVLHTYMYDMYNWGSTAAA